MFCYCLQWIYYYSVANIQQVGTIIPECYWIGLYETGSGDWKWTDGNNYDIWNEAAVPKSNPLACDIASEDCCAAITVAGLLNAYPCSSSVCNGLCNQCF